MTDNPRPTADAEAAAGTSSKFRNWRGTLNCGISGESCRLTVEGEYHLNMRDGWRELKKRKTDLNPKLFTIDVVDTPGLGGDWIELRGEFDAGKEVEHVILRDEHGNTHKFQVRRM